jgi:uncharacterized SAM-binding protein YcdF (DUF218 family)
MESTWTWSWAFRNIVAELLMPPILWISFGLFFLILLRNRRKIQFTLIGFMFVLLSTTSSIFFSQMVCQMTDPWMHWPQPLDLASLKTHPSHSISLEEHSSLPTSQHNAQALQQSIVKPENQGLNPQAIVILGGGVRRGALDLMQYQKQDVTNESMERLRMGARLAKVTQLPILVTGGRPDRIQVQDRSEAEIMAQVLANELGVKVKWLESRSNTTLENASFSAKILQENHVKSIYLVSHDWHLPRAIQVFQKEGFTVTPAPTGFQYHEKMTPLDYLPSVEGFAQTRHYWHEIIGRIWYAFQ